MVKYTGLMARRRKIRRIKSLRDLDIGRPSFELSPETKRGIIIVLLFTFGIVSLLSLFDLAGTLGIYLNAFLKAVFGISRWYFPLLLLVVGYFLLRPLKYSFKGSNVLGLIFFIFGFNGLIHLVFHSKDLLAAAKVGAGGGYLGLVLAWPFFKLMGFWASLLVLLALAVIGFILLFDISFSAFFGQAEAEAPPGGAIAGLPEFVENARLLVRRNTRARIGDRELDLVGSGATHRESDAALARREFHGIGQQVGEDLGQAHRVALHPGVQIGGQ